MYKFLLKYRVCEYWSMWMNNLVSQCKIAHSQHKADTDVMFEVFLETSIALFDLIHLHICYLL